MNKGYIYKITNKINNKSYIGQTKRHPTERWEEHIQIANNLQKNKHGLIHLALSKYGINNFIFEVLEECNAKDLNNKEKFWISYYNTYKNGYNMTLGGEGNCKIDYNLVVSLYKTGKYTCSSLGKKLSISTHTIGKILTLYNIPHNEDKALQLSKMSNYANSFTKKSVKCIDKKTKQIKKIFNSQTEAAEWVIQNGYSKASKTTIQGHIGEVCSGKWKSAYGFIWKYHELIPQT